MLQMRNALRLAHSARTNLGHIVSRYLHCEPLEERTLLAGVSFDLAARIPMGESDSVQAEDFDKDGDQDLIVLHQADANFSVFLNDGMGAFGEEQRFETGEGPRNVAIADFTGDQIVDLAITQYGDNAIAIHRGVGDGTFERMEDYETKGSTSAYLVAGDWDSDGDMDLAVANQYSRHISVLMGHGDGSFEAPIRYSSEGQGTTGITAGDFDEDGDMDLATSNYFAGTGDRTVSVLLGNGDKEGTFAPAVTYHSGAESWALRNADVNRDGHLDLVVTTILGPSILRGNGDGTFEPAILYDTFPRGASNVPDFDNPILQPFGFDLGDLNGDGVLDLVLANWIGWHRDTGNSFGMLSVMLGVGDGTFEDPSIIDIGGWPRAVTTADLDGDGDLDLAAVGLESVPLTLLFNSSQKEMDRLPGDANGDGIFNSSDLVAVFQAGEYEDQILGNSTFEEGDWNGDGDSDSGDLVMAFQAGHYVS